MTDCTRKTIFGNPACRFEGRYDQKDAASLTLDGTQISDGAVSAAAEAMRATKIYVRDVCTKCGRTIERSK